MLDVIRYDTEWWTSFSKNILLRSEIEQVLSKYISFMYIL